MPAIDRFLGIDGSDPRAVMLLDERMAALQPRMPWIYAMIGSCLIGVLLTFDLQSDPPLLAVILLGVSAVRGTTWLRLRQRPMKGEEARRRLRQIGFGSAILIVGMSGLVGSLVPTLDPVRMQLMFVMSSTCAVALAAPLAALPSAARVTYLALGIPAALIGMFGGADRAASAASFNLLLCNLILLYLLRMQDRAFVWQLDTRIEGQEERARAESAEQVAIEERTLARTLAATDFLTGLANRRAFLAAIQEGDARSEASTVMLLDLDGFKPINDTFGHDVGDQLLMLVAGRLRETTGANATVARLGGDEFAIFFAGVAGAPADAPARQIVAALSQPYPIGEIVVSVSACCGVATLPAGERDPSNVLREADLALLAAKNNGRASVEPYSAGLGEEMQRRTEIECALRAPGVEHDIELLYQPITTLKTGQIVAFEALARWSHSRLGAIAPSDFFPITEQMQMVESISQSLLRRAARTALQWRPGQRLSFNLSAVQLCSWGSSDRILQCLDEAGLVPDRLQIEVTETAMMADFETARSNLATLQDRGVKVLLDDFGAGYASISYLREIAFDGIKLDGSLVTASQNADGARLLKGVIDLARAVGVPCIAEHVETAEQARLLAAMECGFGQGFWLGHPVDARTAAALSEAGGVTRTVDRRRVA